MSDFKSHLPVQTHKDGVSFTPGSEFTMSVAAYEATGGTLESLRLTNALELMVSDSKMRSSVYNQDAAFTAGDAGLHILAVRQDVLATDTSADGDFASLKVNAEGALYIYGHMKLDIEVEEDAAHVSGQKGLMPLAVRNDLNTTMTSADGDYSPLTTDKTGAMRVTVVDPTASNTELVDYNTSVAVAVGASADHDYTVGSGITLKLDDVYASASGRIKVEVIADGSTIFVGFNSAAQHEVKFSPKGKVEVAAGAVLRVSITNEDESPQDVYSTSLGYLI
jgi:hypothetical protein